MSKKPNKLAIYTGRRIMSNGKVSHSFLMLPEKKTVYYGKIRGVWIGHTYKCWAKSMLVRPERADMPRVDNPEWDAQDALVADELARKRAESKLKTSVSPAMKKAVEAIKPLVESVNWIDHDVLVRHLVRLARDKK